MRVVRDIAVILLLIVLTMLLLVGLVIGVQLLMGVEFGGVTSNQESARPCGMWYCVTPEVPVCCSLLVEATVTPEPVLCDCSIVTETPFVLTSTPHGTEPPRTLGPTNTPEVISTPVLTNTPVVTNTPIPTSTNPIPTATSLPEPTNKPKCNRGLGNRSEGCDPPGSDGKPGNAGEENERNFKH